MYKAMDFSKQTDEILSAMSQDCASPVVPGLVPRTDLPITAFSSIPYSGNIFSYNPYSHLIQGFPQRNQPSLGHSSQLPIASSPLGDVTSAVLNSEPPTTVPSSPPPRKRKNNYQSTRGRQKRQRRNEATNTPPSMSCGVGPSRSVPSSVPLDGTWRTCGDVASVSSDAEQVCLSTRPSKHRVSAATDVWWFMRPLDTAEEPSEWPNVETEPRLTDKPKSKFLGCKLCTDTWKTWNHLQSKSMTSCYRAHLQSCHREVYETEVKAHGLKEQHHKSSEHARTHEDFDLDTFHRLLMQWIVVDDQSLNIVECEEFRELILYCTGGDLDDEDFMHRSKLRTEILLMQKKVFEKRKANLLRAEGRLSFTTDLWSDPTLRSFMAVTVHLLLKNEEGRLEFRSNLIAFKYVEGDHSGANLGQIFHSILSDYNITEKIGLITMDNASNNGTLMSELETILFSEDIEFDRNGNRIQCFPHIINLACQAFLDELKINPHAPRLYVPPPADQPSVPDEVASTSTPAPPTNLVLHHYAQCLSKDLIRKSRELVAVCRASGQRRKQLEDIIIEGNTKGFWDNGKTLLPVLQLLRDCETRWSSTHQMIRRILQLYPAIKVFLHRSDLPEYQFTVEDLDVLEDIDQVLEVPLKAQELLSAERTPTLSLALPTYEIMLEKWKILQGTIPELSHYIGVGISKIEEYIALARKTRIYVHAMALNPTMKFQWMKDHWSPPDVNEARGWILESMIRYQTAQRKENEKLTHHAKSQRPVTIFTAATQAAQAQSRGFNDLRSLDVHQRHRRTDNSTPMCTTPPHSNASEQSASNAAPPLQRTLSMEEMEEQETRKLAEDRRIAESELAKYEEDGLYEFSGPDSSAHIVWFWEAFGRSYPLLYLVAMDALPAQASSVSCERAFSSSKETAALRRSRIGTDLFEALQLLKFSFKQSRLTFTDDIQIAKPEDYTISGPLTAYAARELIATNKRDELADLIRNAEAEGYTAPTLESYY